MQHARICRDKNFQDTYNMQEFAEIRLFNIHTTCRNLQREGKLISLMKIVASPKKEVPVAPDYMQSAMVHAEILARESLKYYRIARRTFAEMHAGWGTNENWLLTLRHEGTQLR